MAIVGNLTVSVQARTDEFERGMRRTRQELGQTQQAVAQISGTFTGLGRTLGGLAAGYASLQGIKAGIEGVVRAGVETQRLSAAFTQITGSVQGSGEAIDFVRGTADKLGLSFTDLAAGYKGIAAAARGTTLEGQATKDIFTAITSASRALALSGEDTSGILLAVQQVMSKGKVAAEELRGQIGERLPGAFQIAARAMGVTTQQLDAMLQTGNILATDFLPRFARQLQSELGGGAEAAADKADAAFARLGNAVQRLGVTIAESGVLDGITNITNALTKLIDLLPRTPDSIKRIADINVQRDLGPDTQATQAQIQYLKTLQIHILEFQKTITETRRDYPEGLANFLLPFDEAALDRARAQYQTFLKNTQEQARRFRLNEAAPELGGANPQAFLIIPQLSTNIQQRLDALTKTLRDIEEGAKLSGGSRFDTIKLQIEAIDKAIKDLESTLAQNKTAAAFLNPSSSAIFQGVSQARLQAALPLIQQIAPQYGVNPNLVAAIAYQESRFNPTAVSPKGAQGLLQLTPGTGAGVGVTDPFDLTQNITGGIRVIAQLFQQFGGDLTKVLAAYNAGPGAVTKYGGIPPFAETQKYVPAVLSTYQALQGQGGAAPLTPALTQLDALRTLRNQLEVELKASPQLAETKLADIQTITNVIEALTDEQKRLQLTAEEYQLYTLAKARASDSTITLAQTVQEENGRLAASNEITKGIRVQLNEQVRDFVFQLHEERTALELTVDQRQQLKILTLENTAGYEAEAKAAREDYEAIVALRDAQVQRDIRTQQLQDIEAIVKGLADERDQLTLTTEALLRKRLALLGASEGQMRLVESLQQTVTEARVASQIGDFFTQTLREAASGDLFKTQTSKISTTKAELAELQKDIAQTERSLALSLRGDPQSVSRLTGQLHDFRKQYVDLQESIRQQSSAIETFWDRLAKKFTDLTLSILFDVSQIKQTLTSLIQQGFGGLSNLFKGGAAAGGAAEGGVDLAAIGQFAIDIGAGAQHGAYVVPGMARVVGEAGPEVFVPRQSGYILPNEYAQGGRGGNVYMTVYAQDAGSFLRSTGEINYRIAQAQRNIQRDS